MTTPILEFCGIKKSYQGHAVLKDVSFSVGPGEIHGLIGENGAGKSTLMNLLFGMPVIHETGGFEGEVKFLGQTVSFKSPLDAMKAGIGMVHQEFMLIPGFTIFENVKLNNEPLKPFLFSHLWPKVLWPMDFVKMKSEATDALKRIGMTLSVDQRVSELPVGHKQFVEIARELANTQLKLIVFDEPTAVLTESEAEHLMHTIKALAKKQGMAVLFISHRLDEIKSLCDRVTVLRDGEKVGQYNTTEITKEQMAEQMVGHKVNFFIQNKTAAKTNANQPLMALRNFSVHMPSEEIKSIDLDIFQGEILGVGGLAGQGKLGLANGLAGLFESEGTVLFNNQSFILNNPHASLARGVGFVSEDRKGTGLMLEDSIENNIAFTSLSVKNDFLKSKMGIRFVDQKKVRKTALEMIELFDIRCLGPTQHTKRLSGGNQQKVCLARLLTFAPTLLMVSEPTRGVDIGAKKMILEKLVELNARMGTTILITSSELVELKSVADRIVIFSKGRISKILHPSAPDVEFGLAMSE